MQRQYVLYNPHANNGRGEVQARTLEGKLAERAAEFVDMTKLTDYAQFILSLDETDKIIICGGDGTLNRFINDTANVAISCSVYYYPTGSGNDFAHDVEIAVGDEPLCIDKYLEDLPKVYVNGMERYFINGIGYGLDGYCCEVGDKIRATSDKPVNYTSIAIKALLFQYTRANATINIDGVTKEYRKVWIAPTMNGRYYGGGMMTTPAQNRLNADGKLSLMVFHRSSKLKTLMIFPSIFKGEHVKNKKYVEIIEGKDVTVKFDRPTSLQIDGETVLGVTEYRAVSMKNAPVTQEEPAIV